MNTLRTHTSGIIAIACCLLACLVVTPTKSAAHGDLIHVIGVVSKISDTSVSVKTQDGKTVDVQFAEKTTYLRAKAPIDKTAIKVGDRVVIHAAKVNNKLVAHTVEIGTTPAPKGAH